MSKTISRGLAAFAVSGIAALSVATPALAVPCPYPNEATECPDPAPQGETFTEEETNAALSGPDTIFPAGTPITFTIRDKFAPGSVVQVSVNGFPLGVFTVGADGTLTGTIRLPADTPVGAATLEFDGFDNAGLGFTAVLPITVTAAGGGDGGGLPFTGAEVGIASLVGAGLLGAGTIAVVAGRRRKVAPAVA